MATITVELPDDRVARLRAIAARLRVPLDDVILAGLEDLRDRPDDALERARAYILRKHADLHRRLA